MEATPGSIWSSKAYWLQDGAQLVLAEIPEASEDARFTQRGPVGRGPLQHRMRTTPRAHPITRRTLEVTWNLVNAATGHVMLQAQHPLFMKEWGLASLCSLPNDTIVFNSAAGTIAVMDMASLAIVQTFGNAPLPAELQPLVTLKVGHIPMTL